VLDGTWTANGTALCQNSYSGAYNVKLKGTILPASDYLVETRFTVLDTDPAGTTWPAAGIDFRVTGSGGNASGYDCSLDLWGYRLVIGEFASGSWNLRSSSAQQSVSTSGPYVMRVEAKGAKLSCEILGSNPTGTLGVFTFHAKACFDYLLVIQAP
jgi:hypothetical protein